MSETHIVVSMSDDFMLVGVKPPLTPAQLKLIEGQLAGDTEGTFYPEWTHFRATNNGQPYSEFSRFRGDYLISERAKLRVLEKAERIAELLRASGEIIVLDEEVRPFDAEWPFW